MPFAYLGLSPNADERSVRRAYAERLKKTRPDDDPQGFQVLHAAYSECLARSSRARLGLEAGNGEVEVAAVPAPTPLPLPERNEKVQVPPSGFDLNDFIDQVLARAQNGNTKALREWLHAHPDMYSFQLKNAIALDVLGVIAEQAEPVSTPDLDVLMAFFGIDDIGPRGWWIRERIQTIREATTLREQFARLPLPRLNRHAPVRWIDRQIDAELVSPPAWWRRGLLLLVPGQLGPARNRILELERIGGDVATAAMQPSSRSLFLALGNPGRIDKRRLMLSLVRSLVYGGAAALVAVMTGLNAMRTAEVATWIGLGFLLQHPLVAGWIQGIAWLRRRYGTWERELSVAALLLVGALLASLPVDSYWPAVVGYLSMVAAALRALTVPRSLVGLLVAAMLWLVEAAIREFMPLPLLAYGSVMLAGTALLPLALDRVLARRYGGDPREQAGNPRPLQFLLLGLFICSIVVAILLLP
jgi:hypothetical protein